MKQETAVVMRLLTWNERRIMNLLADVLLITIDEACADMVQNFNGNIEHYRTVCIDRMVTKGTSRDTVHAVIEIHKLP